MHATTLEQREERDKKPRVLAFKGDGTPIEPEPHKPKNVNIVKKPVDQDGAELVRSAPSHEFLLQVSRLRNAALEALGPLQRLIDSFEDRSTKGSSQLPQLDKVNKVLPTKKDGIDVADMLKLLQSPLVSNLVGGLLNSKKRT